MWASALFVGFVLTEVESAGAGTTKTQSQAMPLRKDSNSSSEQRAAARQQQTNN